MLYSPSMLRTRSRLVMIPNAVPSASRITTRLMFLTFITLTTSTRLVSRFAHMTGEDMCLATRSCSERNVLASRRMSFSVIMPTGTPFLRIGTALILLLTIFCSTSAMEAPGGTLINFLKRS